MDESLYDEFGNYIGPELSGSEVCLLSHINVCDEVAKVFNKLGRDAEILKYLC